MHFRTEGPVTRFTLNIGLFACEMIYLLNCCHLFLHRTSCQRRFEGSNGSFHRPAERSMVLHCTDFFFFKALDQY